MSGANNTLAQALGGLQESHGDAQVLVEPHR